MVQIAGFGFELKEVEYLLVAIILVVSVINVVAFESKEGFIPVLDKRIIGFPECNSNLQNPVNKNLTLISFCIAPSSAELESLSKALNFNGILNSDFFNTKGFATIASFTGIVYNSAVLFVQLLSIFPLIVKTILSLEILLLLFKGVKALFEFLHLLGLF